jgi:hypothetical protein
MRPIKMQIDYGKYGVAAAAGELGRGSRRVQCLEQMQIDCACCVTHELTKHGMLKIATKKNLIMPAVEVEHIYCEVPDDRPINIFRACLSFFNF